MSGGLYSTEKNDFDQTLDLKKIKPYGDTMNDGKTQLSFTLPVPAGDEAIEAAKQLLKKMGFENPQVVFHKELTEGYTFFNCYGSCTHTVDFTSIHVPKVEGTKWDMHETDEFIRENIGRVHIKNLIELVEMLEAEGLRDKVILACGGPRISHELAKELGYDAGFGMNTYADDVASFVAQEFVRRKNK